MAGQTRIATVVLLAIACSADGDPTVSGGSSSDGDSADTVATASQTSAAVTTATTDSGADTSATTGEPQPPDATLEIRFLGVGGFSFRHGPDLVLTAPMYTNPDLLSVQGGDIAADPVLVEAFLADEFVADATAILVGHAHYDHLLDVPLIWAKTSEAVVLGNTSMRNLMLAAGMPDTSLVALDDPALAWVDMRSCLEPDVCTGLGIDNEGAWFEVPGADVRARAMCSMHPDQILGVAHFAEGCVDEVPATLPTKADEWLEGQTLGYLVDFFADGQPTPVFRVYVQDAPTDPPIGFPHPDVLADKRIDVAVLNVGSYDVVENHPAAVIAAVNPRYVVAGHWEDFFRTQEEPIQPLPLQAAPEPFDEAAVAALGADDEPPVLVDGVAAEGRYFRRNPGTDFAFAVDVR